MLIVPLFACVQDEAPADSVADTSSTTDTATPPDDTGGDTTAPPGLHGTVPDEAIAAPEFVATSERGELRDRDALLGHPTVLWFYPAAGTLG
jgi:hypothetical protein